VIWGEQVTTLHLALDDTEIMDIFSRVPGPAARGTDAKAAKPAGRTSLLDPKRAHLLSISIKSIKAPMAALLSALVSMDRSSLSSREVEVCRCATRGLYVCMRSFEEWR
jgi:hypothetical protein